MNIEEKRDKMKKILSLLVLSICFLTGCTFNGNKTVIVKVNDGEIAGSTGKQRPGACPADFEGM